MDQTTIFLTILGMTLVTYLPRLLPVWLLSRRTLPPFVVVWLRYVPTAVLAAMLLPTLVVQEGHINLGLNNLFFWAAIPATLVAWKAKSFFGTVLIGMGIVALARYLWGL
jgi:branched-subunit amino acid transport protein